LVSNGTDNHLILCDLTNKGVAGRAAATALNRARLVLNCNSIPFDPRKPFDPSGIRIGTAAVTSRGMKEGEMKQIAGWLEQVVAEPASEAVAKRVAGEIAETVQKFPAPGLPV